MVHVVRKDRETSGSLIRRFTKRVQETGVILQAKKTKFFTRQKSRNQRRNSALRREELHRQHEWLEKLGKLNEEER